MARCVSHPTHVETIMRQHPLLMRILSDAPFKFTKPPERICVITELNRYVLERQREESSDISPESLTLWREGSILIFKYLDYDYVILQLAGHLDEIDSEYPDEAVYISSIDFPNGKLLEINAWVIGTIKRVRTSQEITYHERTMLNPFFEIEDRHSFELVGLELANTHGQIPLTTHILVIEPNKSEPDDFLKASTLAWTGKKSFQTVRRGQSLEPFKDIIFPVTSEWLSHIERTIESIHDADSDHDEKEEEPRPSSKRSRRV